MKIGILLITLFRIFLGTILFFAGVAKVTDFIGFVGLMARYDLLPMSFVTVFSYLLVSAEIIVGAALILGYFSRGAGLLAAMLFLTFAAAMASALWRALPLDECGCANILFDWFGTSVNLTWKGVFLDGLLFIGSLIVACASQPGYGIQSLRGLLLSLEKVQNLFKDRLSTRQKVR